MGLIPSEEAKRDPRPPLYELPCLPAEPRCVDVGGFPRAPSCVLGHVTPPTQFSMMCGKTGE